MDIKESDTGMLTKLTTDDLWDFFQIEYDDLKSTLSNSCAVCNCTEKGRIILIFNGEY